MKSFKYFIVSEGINTKALTKIGIELLKCVIYQRKISDYIKSQQGKEAVAKLIENEVEKDEISAKNKLISIFYKIEDLYHNFENFISQDGWSNKTAISQHLKDLDNYKRKPEIQKMLSEITSKFGVFNSTRIGSEIADEIIYNLRYE